MVTLFDPPPAVESSATSRAAAVAIEPAAGTIRREILEWLRGRGEHGATRQEIELALGIVGDTVRPRVRELLKVGWIVETDATRPTKSGLDAAILRAT